jgi:hypothetical protein
MTQHGGMTAERGKRNSRANDPTDGGENHVVDIRGAQVEYPLDGLDHDGDAGAQSDSTPEPWRHHRHDGEKSHRHEHQRVARHLPYGGVGSSVGREYCAYGLKWLQVHGAHIPRGGLAYHGDARDGDQRKYQVDSPEASSATAAREDHDQHDDEEREPCHQD